MKTENEVNGLILSIDDWDEIIPGIDKSICELYDYDFPEYLGLECPTPEEYMFDPDAFCEKYSLPTFERFLIEKEYVKYMEEVYKNQDSAYRR